MLAAVLGSCSKSESGAGDQVTVIFNAMDGAFASGESTLDTVVFAGERIAAPADPVRDGYTFECWCAERSCITPVNFPILVSSDKVFYAKWSVNPDKWLISGMLLGLGNLGEWNMLYATYSYDDNNVLNSITFLQDADPYSGNFRYNTRIPLVLKYDGDNVKVSYGSGAKSFTLASMKLKDGQCPSMVIDSADAEMDFTYDAAGYLKGAKLDTTKKTLIELTDVNIRNFCYSDFKLKYHDITEAGEDTTWTTCVTYLNSDDRDITGCINIFNPLFLSFMLNYSGQQNGMMIYLASLLFTSSYFEAPSAYIPGGFSIMGESSEGSGVGVVMTSKNYSLDKEGRICEMEYYSPAGEDRIHVEFSYVEKK